MKPQSQTGSTMSSLYTCTEEQALELARLYDAGKLELGNVTLRHDGNVVAALRASEAA
ncbi:hypothetical protein ABIA13_002115 [Sinorhizobium fredii]